MNQEMFERLMQHAGFGAEDAAVLREFHPRIQGRFPEIVEDFYRRILVDEATRRILQSMDQIVHLRHRFHRWLDEIFLEPRDDSYRLRRVAIGEAHVRVGLPQCYVFSAMAQVRCRLGATLRADRNAPPERLAAALDALAKALDLDLALISSAYHEAEKYRDFVDQAPEMIHAVDREGRFLVVNRTEVRRLGYPEDQLLQMRLEDLVHEDDRAMVQRHLEQVFTRGESRCEVRMLTAGGERMDVEILSTGQRDALSREIVHSRAYVRDITERRQAEQELRKERELERKFLEVAGVLILILDRRGRVRVINRKGSELLGWPRSRILGSDWVELAVPESHRATARTFFERLISGSTPGVQHFESPVVTRSGEERIIEWHTTAILDERGAGTATLSSGQDTTDRRRLMRELLEKESLARLGEMAAVVAHEVKNPLAGIAGAIQVIGDNLEARSPDRAVVKEIVDRITALNATVNDLLLYARPRLPRLTPVRIRQLLADIIRLVNKDASFAGIAVDVRGDDLLVSCDPELTKPVFLNLLVNAAQAMGHGVISLTLAAEDSFARITVADAGPGIPADLRPRVFEPFFSTKHRGTGLGLPIAKRIVEAHGGTIRLDCPETGGTVVTVRLPLPPVAAAP